MPNKLSSPDETYGLTTEELRYTLLMLTGSEQGANDAMAGVAEWLDTARGDAQTFADAVGADLSERERAIGATLASGFVNMLSMAAESSVDDSDYEMADEHGKPVRRRILKEPQL